MISLFLHDLESAFSCLLTASWQASVLVALVLALQFTLRSRLNPRWHHALWLLVIARLLLPALPESAFSLFQFTPQPPPSLVQPVTEPIFSAAPIQLPPQQPQTNLPAPAYPFSLFTLFAVIWLAGATGFLVLTALVNLRFARHVNATPEITDPRLLQIVEAAQSELGLQRNLRRRLRLIESTQLQGPAIMGLFRPTLILPQNVRGKFTDDELRFIFLHELAHLKRGDLILQWLVALLQILHWFNPVLWYAFRRMRADREPATDALVLSRTGEAEKERYGHVLIKLLEHFNQRHSLPTLIGLLEDKDQFKRRFQLIAKFTRTAYAWSLLGVVLIGTLAVACLTKSKPALTANYLITNLSHFVDGVDSLDYSEIHGDPKGEYSRTHWQEMGELQRVDQFTTLSFNSSGKQLGHFHCILSYDGDYGYMYTPNDKGLARQRAPFLSLTQGYSSGLEGPLLPFEFLAKKVELPSSGRVTLQTLKSSDSLAAVAARATLEPDRNRSWEGHPCIAVKIAGGNDRGSSQSVVDFVAYFARDLDLYPIAWEIYRKDKLERSYCVVKLATLPSKNSSQTFRYPALAKGTQYKTDYSSGPYSYEYEAPADLKINTLTKADFTIAPPSGGYIEDRDTHQLIRIAATPIAAPKSDTSNQTAAPVAPPLKLAILPLYVRFDHNIRYDPTISAFFGPVGQFDTDFSLIPGTDQFISVRCLSSTSTSAKLLLNRCWPTGTQPTPLPPNQDNAMVEVPLGKDFSFRIFGSVDVTTTPTVPPPRPDINTPLLGAIYSHDDDKIKSLIAKKEPIIITDMIAAIEMGTPQQVKLLWDNGPHFISPMAYAVSQDATVSDLEKLVASGEKVERPYDVAPTPLGIAARMGNLDVVHWLLDHGANLHASNDPFDLAIKGYSADMVFFLLQKGAKFDREPSPLFTATGFGNFSDPEFVKKRLAVINVLIRAGALKSLSEDRKVGLLVQSCERKVPSFLQAYLDAGINPLTKNSKGQTALEIVKEAYSHRDTNPAVNGMQPCIDILEAAQKSAAPSPSPAKSEAYFIPMPSSKPTPPLVVTRPVPDRPHLPATFDYGPFVAKYVTVEADFEWAGFDKAPLVVSPNAQIYQGQLFAVSGNSLTIHFYSVAKGMTSVSVEKSRIRNIRKQWSGMLIAN